MVPPELPIDIPIITGGTNDEGAVGGLGVEASRPPDTVAAWSKVK